MKKIFTFLTALFTVSILFAQYDNSDYNRQNFPRTNNNRSWNDGNVYNQNPSMNNGNVYRPDHGVDMHSRNRDWNNDQPVYNNRQRDFDRINGDYDRRIDDCSNNTGMNNWERGREIERLRKERAAKLKAFGGGVLLGGVLGAILGSQL